MPLGTENFDVRQVEGSDSLGRDQIYRYGLTGDGVGVF